MKSGPEIESNRSLYVSAQPDSADRSKHQSQRWWLVTGSVIVATGALLRVFELTLKPLHHDEGVNGMFLLSLFRKGIYLYDAANYHGPSLYYFALVSSSINNLLFGGEGPSISAIRSIPVVFGIGLILLMLTFRNHLGVVGALTAAGLIAFSPGMVYFSRDFIHEILLVFFTVWLVVCALRFWDTSNPRYLLLGAIAAALMVSTKETAPISLFCIALGAAVAFVWVPRDPMHTLAKFGGGRNIVLMVLMAVAFFLICIVLFFSSFFGNYPQGIFDAVTTYTYWVRTGIARHTAPPHTYLRWLISQEAPIVLLAAIGTVLAFARRHRFGVFSGVWGFALLLVYSLLPYKTPWIQLNMIAPMCLVAGYAVQELWSSRRTLTAPASRVAPAGLITLTMAVVLYQSWQLNFRHYDDPQYVYPYVQTHRSFLGLVNEVNEIAINTDGYDTSVAIMAREYWPLPWYLRDYKNAVFYGKLTSTPARIVIGSNRQERMLQRQLAGRYQLIGNYRLRPGVELVLFVANPDNR